MRVAVIGAGGFVGKALTERLISRSNRVVPVVRRPGHFADEVQIGDLNSTDWAVVLAGTEVVALTAARVHVMKDRSADPLADFLRVNRDGALSVLAGAADAGVRRMVFVSTVKVNGETTEPGRPFRWDDTPKPQDAYGISKWEAERALATMAAERSIELTIVRPTLVYGPGVGANFAALMKWVDRGVPLPLGDVTDNRRSLVGIDNLTDLLAVCMTDARAAGQVFMASDGQDVSTAALLHEVGRGLGRTVRLPRVPVGVLRAAAAMVGQAAALQRLTGSLQVDIAHNREILGWTPPVNLEEGLARAARAFRQQAS